MFKNVRFDAKIIEIAQVWRKQSRKVIFMLQMAAILKNGNHHFLKYSCASFEPTVFTNVFYAFSFVDFVNNRNQKTHQMPFLIKLDP